MPQGIQSWGEDGRIQFNSETMMFGLVGKGAASFVSSASPVTGNNKHPVFQAFVSNLPYYQFAVLNCSVPCELQIASAAKTPTNALSIQTKAANGVQFTLYYWLFSAYSLLPDKGFGIQAFNVNGQKCLDLAYAPLRIIANTDAPINNGHNTNQNYSVPGAAGKTLGFLRYGTVENRTDEVFVTPGPSDPANVARNFRGVPRITAIGGGFNMQEGQDAYRPATNGASGAINVAAGGVLTCDMTNL